MARIPGPLHRDLSFQIRGQFPVPLEVVQALSDQFFDVGAYHLSGDFRFVGKSRYCIGSRPGMTGSGKLLSINRRCTAYKIRLSTGPVDKYVENFFPGAGPCLLEWGFSDLGKHWSYTDEMSVFSDLQGICE